MSAKELLELMGLSEDDAAFRLRVFEVLSQLLLLCHHLRGRFRLLVHSGAVKFSNPHQQNYKRWDVHQACIEEMVWELVLPRAWILIVQEWQETGMVPVDLPRRSDKLGRELEEE